MCTPINNRMPAFTQSRMHVAAQRLPSVQIGRQKLTTSCVLHSCSSPLPPHSLPHVCDASLDSLARSPARLRDPVTHCRLGAFEEQLVAGVRHRVQRRLSVHRKAILLMAPCSSETDESTSARAIRPCPCACPSSRSVGGVRTRRSIVAAARPTVRDRALSPWPPPRPRAREREPRGGADNSPKRGLSAMVHYTVGNSYCTKVVSSTTR